MYLCTVQEESFQFYIFWRSCIHQVCYTYYSYESLFQELYVYFIRQITNRPSASENAVVIDDVPSLVEWTPFDDHWIPGRLPVRQFAMSCSSSILASCLFNASVLAENKSTYISSQVPFSQLKIPPKSSMAQLESLVFKSYNDSNITDVNYDCYLDIKLGSMERYVQ